MKDYADLLVVTVTKVETRAVLVAFERATGHKARAVSIGERVYRDLGTLNGSRVFLALSEMGAGGLGASQQAVQKGIASLHPAAVIMVGIAFGMSEQKQSLGDILVSRQLMLYEMQRVGTSQLIPRGDRAHASSWLLDHLKSADLDWTGAPVRFGLLVTGEKLVDSIDYRAQLQRLEREAIGGEMEGAGLYIACQDAKVDWVLVKAICDWADGSKSQDKEARQQRAAENSAAFVVHALQHAALQRLSAPAITGNPQTLAPAITQHREDRGPLGKQGAVPIPGQKPTRFSIRSLLGEVLRTTEDLNAFCIDNFDNVARRFSSGMTRVAREDLLLELVDTDDILAIIRVRDPSSVARHAALLQYE